MPTGAELPSMASLPAPSSPAPLANAPNPFGVPPPPAQAPLPAPPPVVSQPPTVSEPAAPISMISAIPDSMDEPEEGLRAQGRSKWYLIAAAIVCAAVTFEKE